ncbi:SDR family NAD(P)-dependent oxidoreductase [Streptomyces sp. NPDC088553]|uniref:SDR family NAD(P)-dependent oxidoreductase n=1 Tax=Streptomyces sp. NPDC088553 TaxID=3365864 RepID=UPI0037FB4754
MTHDRTADARTTAPRTADARTTAPRTADARTDGSQEFAGRIALVTGGASGIGLAVARRLAHAGAAVAVADHDADRVAAGVTELTERGAEALAVRMDVTDDSSLREGVEAALAAFGGLHLAVDNAGVAGARVPVAETPAEEWRRVVSTNLDGVFHSLRHELPAILASGGGAVVNMSSILGTNGSAGSAAYVAAKHGVVGLTKTAALEYASRGVRINAVGPGYIDTPLLAGIGQEEYDALVALHPAGRLGRAEEVAELVAFLLLERASFVHGGHHLVDGAYAAR